MSNQTDTQPLLMLDLEGLTVTAEEQDLLRHPAVGGLILFSRNYQEEAAAVLVVASILDGHGGEAGFAAWWLQHICCYQ